MINAYTDGSRIGGMTGAGYTIRSRNAEIGSASIKLPEHTTVFQAEIVAVRDAGRALLAEPRVTASFIKIFIDSQAAIKALANSQISSQLVYETVDVLNKVASKCRRLQIVWIPAHRGHSGNERADILAKWGARTIGPAEFTPKPVRQVKNDIKRAIYEDWAMEWRNSPLANHTRSFYNSPCSLKARFVYKLARLELGRFVRIVTGHNNLNFFQNKIGLCHDSLCRFCGSGPETITHLMSNCPRFSNTVRSIFPSGTPGPDMTWSVRELLEFSYVPDINLAFEGSWERGDPPTGGDLCDLFTQSEVTSSDDEST